MASAKGESSSRGISRYTWHSVVSFHSRNPQEIARLIELKPLIEAHMRRLVRSFEITDVAALDDTFAAQGNVVREMIYAVESGDSARYNWSKYLGKYLKGQYELSTGVAESYLPIGTQPRQR
jgi:hypothetical protein